MKNISLLLCTIGLAAISSTSLAAQGDWVELGYVDGLNAGDSFGSSMLPLGDVNNDGYEDYLVASPRSGAYHHLAGALSIHSGLDDSVIASVNGSISGQRIGYSMCLLGTHDDDDIIKIAASSPFSDSNNGIFSGVVNIYAFDPSTLSFYLWQELAGDNAGAIFGVSVAALDNDGDGDLDLAVSSLGDGEPLVGQPLDGSIRFFNVSDLLAEDTLTNTQYGASNSSEMFGFAMCYADSNGQEALLIGAPFANTDNSGAAILYKASNNSSSTLANLSSTAGANLGFAVAAGSDITGDGIADFIASAPNVGAGTVFSWNDSQLTSKALNGTENGEKFGYSLAITGDANFDGADDLIVGAPKAGNDAGRFAVHEMKSLSQNKLFEEEGSNGQLLGRAVATAGDVSDNDKSEILVGAIGENNRTGRVYIYSPPEQDIGPMVLDIVGNYEWESDLELNVTNLSEGEGDLYWYIGSQAGSSTSAEGHELDISGNVQLLGTMPGFAGTQAQWIHPVSQTIPGGDLLVFQVVEIRNARQRASNIDGGYVIDPGVTMFVDGNIAGDQITISTQWGLPLSIVYLYATLQPPDGTSLYNAGISGHDWQTNLKNPFFLVNPAGQSNVSGEYTSPPINVPATASGRTAYFQAYDWDWGNPELSNIVSVIFQ